MCILTPTLSMAESPGKHRSASLSEERPGLTRVITPPCGCSFWLGWIFRSCLWHVQLANCFGTSVFCMSLLSWMTRTSASSSSASFARIWARCLIPQTLAWSIFSEDWIFGLGSCFPLWFFRGIAGVGAGALFAALHPQCHLQF